MAVSSSTSLLWTTRALSLTGICPSVNPSVGGARMPPVDVTETAHTDLAMYQCSCTCPCTYGICQCHRPLHHNLPYAYFLVTKRRGVLGHRFPGTRTASSCNPLRNTRCKKWLPERLPVAVGAGSLLWRMC
ncbi:hypothetical protein C8Q74DRAFT_1281121 [Fomes fomentarius]|nr:hypothetical protein C8Q74DRAFT_1281121 [Fomes fomentarius]